jgi:hypothetical protein
MQVNVKEQENKNIAVKFNQNLVTPQKCSLCGKSVYVGKTDNGRQYLLSLNSDGSYIDHKHVCIVK